MFCKKCGTQLHPQARFCKKCGAAVSATRPVADFQPHVQPPAPQIPLTPPVAPVAPPPPPLRTTVVVEPDPPPPPPVARVEPEPPPAHPTVITEPEPPRLEALEPVRPTLITITENLRPIAAADQSLRPTAAKDEIPWPAPIEDKNLWPASPSFETQQPTRSAAPDVAARKTFHHHSGAAGSSSIKRFAPGLIRNRLLWFAAIGLALVAASVAFWWFRSGNEAAQSADSQAANQTAPTPPAEMVYVPGGEFMMGYGAGELQERPAHKVAVNSFFIDRNEVTCEEYSIFISATGHRAPKWWENGHYPEGYARRPVTGIDWDDANAYAAWAGKRLPAEEEWEFAARGTDGRRYAWGNEWRPNMANDISSKLAHTTDVGSYPAGASPFGANDMIGNAWEWTASDYVPYPGGQLPVNNLAGPLKTIRGSSFGGDQDHATATFRLGWPARDEKNYSRTGFRCVKDAPAPATPQSR